MNLDLERRRGAWDIVTDACRLFLAHLPVFFVATLVVVAPVVIVVDGILGEQLADGLDANPSPGIAALSTLLSSIVIPALVTALHVRAVQGLAEGVEPTVGSVLRQALTVAPAALVSVLLYTLGVAVGLLLFIVPGIYLAVRWYFNAQAVVVDGERGPEALKASGRLVEGNWWGVLGTILLLALVAVAVAFVVGGLIGLAVFAITDSGVALVVVTIIAQTIALSISALGGTLLFFDLRREKGLREEPVGGFLPPRA